MKKSYKIKAISINKCVTEYTVAITRTKYNINVVQVHGMIVGRSVLSIQINVDNYDICNFIDDKEKIDNITVFFLY